jgi:hypothetical protein
MASHITDEEWDRIDQFAKANVYERGPDLLIPEEATDETEDEGGERRKHRSSQD